MTHTKYRILKVCETGDFWAKKTKPQIRLVGKWLEKAGIPANHHVQVENPKSGVLSLRILND